MKIGVGFNAVGRSIGMLVIGLTGSIGMGKTAMANLFREVGIPVYDADAAVHRLYQGEAVAAIAKAFPQAIRAGVVDRQRLAEQVIGKPEALHCLETIVHPLVAMARNEFVRKARQEGRHMVVLDVPLLFETEADRNVDIVLVVSATGAIQRARVLARPGMTEEKLAAVLARQVPDAEKRRRAHFVIRTDRDFTATRRQLQDILRALAARAAAEATDA
jgi:dephospho-CoA kinase